MLILQKDENIQVLMTQTQEAEELKDKVEAQERINSEKLMFELAGRIEAHERISVKLEEMRQVLEQRDLALQNIADDVSLLMIHFNFRTISFSNLIRVVQINFFINSMIYELNFYFVYTTFYI